MKGLLQRVVQRLLDYDMSLEAIFKTLTSIIIVRTVIEKLLSQRHVLLFDPTDFYRSLVGDLHMYFSWVVIFLSMSIPVALFMRIRYRDALKLTLVGFCITIFVPFIDYAATWGKGDEIHYFYNFDTLFYNYVQVFNPFAAAKGLTLGVRLEIVTLFAGSFLFAWQGLRRSFVRSLLLALTLYTIVYVYAYLIPIHELFGITSFSEWVRQTTTEIGPSQAIFFSYLGPFILCLILIALVLRRRLEGMERVVSMLVYPSRLLFYLWILVFGFLYAAQQTGTLPRIFNQPDLYKLLCAACSIAFFFVYAKVVNDIHDLSIDRVSNKDRLLVKGTMTPEEANGLATILLVISGVLAVPVEQDFFYLWCFVCGLSYVYSAPPFRLRRFWPVAHVILAMIGSGIFMAGACIVHPDDFNWLLSRMDILACMFLAFFILCQIKDLKDIEGDRAANLFNLFGRVRFPRATALLFFGGFLVAVFFPAVHVGIGTAAIVIGDVVCACAALWVALRARQQARLDRLFIVALVFLVYLTGNWLTPLWLG